MKENYCVSQEYYLNKLRSYLNYEVSSSVLYFLSFQVFIFIFFASAAALIFTPFMLYVLSIEKKKGWIIFFIILVVVPLIALLILGVIVEFSRPLLFVCLGLFYFYCFILCFEVNEWAKEASAKKQYLIDKKKREYNLKSFADRFN